MNAIPADHGAAASCGDFASDFELDVLTGLAQTSKAIPCRWLYDTTGSELFEAITQVPEYYPTRTETSILRQRAAEMADFAGECRVLLEYGAGSVVKTEILLSALKGVRVYVPIDVSAEFLTQTCRRLERTLPDLKTAPVVADFTRTIALPLRDEASGRIGFFPGSTIGNLSAAERTGFLARLRRDVGPNGVAIVGVDLEKDPDVLVPAYDDRAGVTARFNLNVLTRINRELGGTFNDRAFAHLAVWNAAESAIEMHLRSLVDQVVSVSERTFTFRAGETIHTESSRKYSIASFSRLARHAGFSTQRVWTDDEGLFAVFGLA